LGALLDIAGVLRRFQPRRIIVVADGRRFRTRALQVDVCNAPRYGMSFAAAPRARMDDGWLDVVIYERISPWQLIRHYASIAGGGTDYRLHARTLRAREVVVMPEHTAWPVHADA
jgi:diacylglycerol kinase family enzyme